MPTTAEWASQWTFGDTPPPDGSADADLFPLVCSAVVTHITERYDVDPDPAEWTDTQTVAACLQIARLWKRKDTPQGVQTFGDNGVVTFSALDRDVENMLTRKVAIA